jgi:hypothetical protein
MNFYAFFVISDNNEFLVRFQSSQIPAMRCPDFTLRCYTYIYIYNLPTRELHRYVEMSSFRVRLQSSAV